VPLKSYRDLDAWKAAMDLVEAIYSLTRHFPDDERYGLTGQMRRAAVSIPSNIAEGYGRVHRGDYVRFLSNARGSLCELETQLMLCVRLHYAPREDAAAIWKQAQQAGKLLSGLLNSLKE
jgi:four helix bundle protein